jgi:hypothetical protein
MKAGTAVEAIAMLFFRESDFEHVFGQKAQAAVVVQVAALGQGVEKGVELSGRGTVADFSKAIAEIRAKQQLRKKG